MTAPPTWTPPPHWSPSAAREHLRAVLWWLLLLEAPEPKHKVRIRVIRASFDGAYPLVLAERDRFTQVSARLTSHAPIAASTPRAPAPVKRKGGGASVGSKSRRR